MAGPGSKRKVGVCFDSEVVEWLDAAVEQAGLLKIEVNRSQLVNFLLKKIMRKISADEVAKLLVREFQGS
jgi:hypothetical protein